MAWFSLSEVLKIKPPTDEKNLKRLWMRPKPSKKTVKPKNFENKIEKRETEERKEGRINIYV